MDTDMMDDDLDDLDGCLDNGVHYKEVEIREQDRFLPIANIARIMKKILPSNVKVAKDAKESIQGCISEYISFITSEASDRCQQEKRKTINGDDILWAMGTLGFDKYVDPLKVYLSKYRDAVKGDRPDKKAAVKKDIHANSMHTAQPKTTASSSSSGAIISSNSSSAATGASSVSSHPPRIMSSQPYSGNKMPVATTATTSTMSSSSSLSLPPAQVSHTHEGAAASNVNATTTSKSGGTGTASGSSTTIMSVTPPAPAHGQQYIPQTSNVSTASSSSANHSTGIASNNATLPAGAQSNVASSQQRQAQFGTPAFPHHLPPPPVHAILPGLDSIWTPSFGLDSSGANTSSAGGVMSLSFDDKTPNFLTGNTSDSNSINAGANTLMPNVNAYSAFAMKQQQQMYPGIKQQGSGDVSQIHTQPFAPQSNFQFAADGQSIASTSTSTEGTSMTNDSQQPVLLLSGTGTSDALGTTSSGIPSPVVKKQKLG